MSLQQTLRVVEPQMINLFHSPFNAALLHTAALAYPDLRIAFHAQPAHLLAVREILKECAPDVTTQVEWNELPTMQQGSLPQRWLRTRGMLKELLATGDRLLFCSISRLQLLVLKQLMKRNHVARCVLHGDLESVARTAAFPANLLTLRRALERPQPPGLRYVLLSDSIQRNLPEALQRGMGAVGILDHPYHFPRARQPLYPLPEGLVFGIFGNTGDARALEQVARGVRKTRPDIRFRVIGFLDGPATVQRVAPLVEGATATPLAREAFQTSAQSVTHALWLAEPSGFRLRASGTLFDALAYLKPVVYTANPYFDGYGLVEAGIGVRCVSLEEVVTAVLRLATEASTPGAQERYADTTDRIERFRTRFTPEALVGPLRAALAL